MENLIAKANEQISVSLERAKVNRMVSLVRAKAAEEAAHKRNIASIEAKMKRVVETNDENELWRDSGDYVGMEFATTETACSAKININ